jgi:hypothetical protein
VPGTSLTNWPDQWIHSSADDLENVDATQLERNAVVVAAVAHYFAALGDDDVPALAAYVAARGRARAAADTATAVAHLMRAEGADRVAAWGEASALVRESHAKEERALASLGRLDGSGRARRIIDRARGQLEDSRRAEVHGLEEAWRAVTGGPPPAPEVDETAQTMARTVYAPDGDAAEIGRSLRKVEAPTGLHPLVLFEILNFADGTRTAWAIYEAVTAEALSAGHWYYGGVSPTQVQAVLDSAVKAGALRKIDR